MYLCPLNIYIFCNVKTTTFNVLYFTQMWRFVDVKAEVCGFAVFLGAFG